MKRTILFLALAALPLAGCSGKAKDAGSKDAAAAKAKAGEKNTATTTGEHVNPWAKDSAPGAEASPAAADKAKPAAKPSAAADEHVNPWAKDPPPGSVPSEPAKDKAKKAK